MGRSVKASLAYTPEFRSQYHGERTIKGLQALAEVKLNEANDALDTGGLIEAARERRYHA